MIDDFKTKLSVWIVKQYAKVGDSDKVRNRGYNFLLFSEVDTHLSKAPFYRDYYQVSIPLQLLALSVLLVRFLGGNIPLSVYNVLMISALFYNIKKIREVRTYLRVKLLRFLHTYLEEYKEDRESYILNEVNEKITHVLPARIIRHDADATPELPEHILLLRKDMKAFCEKYFKLSSPNFVRYYTERAVDPVDNQLNPYFIDASLLIPKREELGSDLLRRVLINPAKELYSPEKEAHIKILFQDYTPQQIEVLFTNHQGIDKFKELFLLPPHPLEIYRSIKEILHHELFKPKVLPRELEDLEKKSFKNKIKVVVARTKDEYIRAGQMFDNCLKNNDSYFTRGGNLVTFYQEGAPWACLHIKDRKIKEIKGISNEAVDKYEIFQILVNENVINP